MWSIVDIKTGEIIYKDEFKSQPSVIVNNKFCVKNGSGLYDYFTVDNVTRPINSTSFLYATSLNENNIALSVLKGQCISLINDKCEVIAQLDNSIVSADEFSNGYSVITNEYNKKGYINEKGEVVIKPSYDKAFAFSADGISIVGREVDDSMTQYFAIDTNGNMLFSFSSNEYRNFGSFSEGFIPVQKNNNEDVILLDVSGQQPYNWTLGKWESGIPCWLGLNDGIIVFKEGDAYGLKNKKGEIVIRAKYDSLTPVEEINNQYYHANKQGKFGIIDIDDNVVVPFEYSILGYLNKDILFAGADKYFTFINKDLKTVGDNKFTNLSFFTGSSIYSNYFIADQEVRKLISNITDSTFFSCRKGMVLRDFENMLSGYKYADIERSSLDEDGCLFSFLYTFDQNLSSQQYEYVDDYSIPTSAEYNYKASLMAVEVINNSFKNFQRTAVEEMAKIFDEEIQKLGFKPVQNRPYWFKNDKNIAVALSYDNSSVSVLCSYSPIYINTHDVKRIYSENFLQDDAQIDYIDTFWLETSNVFKEIEAFDAEEEPIDEY